MDRGFVTYSNEAKAEMIDVPLELINRLGAVSKEVALSMAEGALARSRAGVTVAVTGVAGPGGAPMKSLWALFTSPRREKATRRSTANAVSVKTRADIRHATVLAALDLVLENLRQP